MAAPGSPAGSAPVTKRQEPKDQAEHPPQQVPSSAVHSVFSGRSVKNESQVCPIGFRQLYKQGPASHFLT